MDGVVTQAESFMTPDAAYVDEAMISGEPTPAMKKAGDNVLAGTIPARKHQPQLIYKNYGEMHRFISLHSDLMVFYNGPKCGASAPDHLHFQAGTNGIYIFYSLHTEFKFSECNFN